MESLDLMSFKSEGFVGQSAINLYPSGILIDPFIEIVYHRSFLDSEKNLRLQVKEEIKAVKEKF